MTVKITYFVHEGEQLETDLVVARTEVDDLMLSLLFASHACVGIRVTLPMLVKELDMAYGFMRAKR